LYRTGAVLAAIALSLALASCGGGDGTTAGGTTTSGEPTDGSTKVPSVGADSERAGTTAKRRGARHPHGGDAESAPQTSSEITYGPRGELTTLAAAKPTAGCQARLGDLVDRMDDLRQSLLAGLDYSEYVLRVQAVRAAYEAVPIDRLSLTCVAGPASDAEAAFNQYLRAANLWGECAGTAGCAASSIESRLQHRWKIAWKSLDAAKRS
jgi:hypothetical protein